MGAKQTDPLTEEEVRYVVSQACDSNPTTQAIAFRSIMDGKNRREKLKNPNLTEIDCMVCGQIKPIAEFRKVEGIGKACAECVQRYNEKNGTSY